MNVCQERRGTPSPNLHDFVAGVVVEAQCHGARCSQGVGANAVEGVSLCREPRADRRCPNGNKDICGNDMYSWADKT